MAHRKEGVGDAQSGRKTVNASSDATEKQRNNDEKQQENEADEGVSWCELINCLTSSTEGLCTPED